MTGDGGPCHYCRAPGVMMATASELSELIASMTGVPVVKKEKIGDLFVCNSCKRLLQDPMSAAALMSGDMNMELRSSMPSEKIRPLTEELVRKTSGHKPRN